MVKIYDNLTYSFIYVANEAEPVIRKKLQQAGMQMQIFINKLNNEYEISVEMSSAFFIC